MGEEEYQFKEKNKFPNQLDEDVDPSSMMLFSFPNWLMKLFLRKK